VSSAAVSFALGSNPRKVSPATRERIARVAREMGYQPNPFLSAWQTHVRSRRPVHVQAALAWINDHPESDWWNPSNYQYAIKAGADQRAAELGYRIDEVWLPDAEEAQPEVYVEKCLTVLRARGIFGVLLPHLAKKARTAVDWKDRAVVVVGKTERLRFHFRDGVHHLDAQHPEIYHWINTDYFHNTSVAYRKLTEIGYRRIGLAISTMLDMESDEQISCAFLNESKHVPPAQRVPILKFVHGQMSTELKIWIRKHQPDVILATESYVKAALDPLGLRVPEEIGLAHMDVKFDVADWSGIDRHSAVIGAAAVDLLTSSMQRNEVGVPLHPMEVLIKGKWVQGRTTRG
ncbi:MAG: LacI family DNA-binding transcriptional regulator, partial [Kiritimatiellia bacterium]|nr:LacI family DNA-binding transcriptional regulator [Kiritimatiellia bacterium]